MPVSSYYFPTSASSSGSMAWTDYNNVLADDAAFAYATARRELDYPYGYTSTRTASLYCTSFTGLTTGLSPGDRIDGVEIEVYAKVDRTDLGTVLQVRYGAGSELEEQTLTTSWAAYVFGGATSLLDNPSYNMNALNVASYAATITAESTIGTGDAIVSVEYVKVRIYWTDTHCDALTFTPVASAAIGEWQYSDVVTIAGMPGGFAAPVSFGSTSSTWNFLHEAQVMKNNDGKWYRYLSAANMTTVNGDTWQMRRRFFYARPDDSDVGTLYDLNVFGVTGRFTVTTVAVDRTNTPAIPTISDRTGFPRSSLVKTPFTFKIEGVNAVDITGDVYADGMYVWFPAATGDSRLQITTGPNHPSLAEGSVQGPYDETYIWPVYEGDHVEYWVPVGATFSDARTADVWVGSVNYTWTYTSEAADTTPTQVYFTTPAAVATTTVTTSNLVTIAGINDTANVTFSTSGGSAHEYQKNGGAWTAVGATTVANGDTMKVRMTSPGAGSQSGNITMKIGTMHATFCIVTTGGDVTPDAFTFTDVTDAIPGLLYTSNAQVLAGTTAAQPMLATVSPGFEIRVGAGAWTASSLSVAAGDSITIRGYAPMQAGTVATCVVTIGGTQDTWTITSRKAHAFWD